MRSEETAKHAVELASKRKGKWLYLERNLNNKTRRLICGLLRDKYKIWCYNRLEGSYGAILIER